MIASLFCFLNCDLSADRRVGMIKLVLNQNMLNFSKPTKPSLKTE